MILDTFTCKFDLDSCFRDGTCKTKVHLNVSLQKLLNAAATIRLNKAYSPMPAESEENVRMNQGTDLF